MRPKERSGAHQGRNVGRNRVPQTLQIISPFEVKSRLVRGREALRKRLERHLPAFGMTMGEGREHKRRSGTMGNELEVMP